MRLDEPGAEGELSYASAIILGSAIYMGRWLKPARELLERRAETLRSVPLWLFSSGPVGDPPLPADAEPREVVEAAAALGARGHAIFSGKLDAEALTRRERMVVKALRAAEGDFRDWDAIRGWAAAIANALDPS